MKTIGFLIVALICASVLFTNCKKDKDDFTYSSVTAVNAKVEGGSKYDFDKVLGVMYYGNYYDDELVVNEGNYTNGGFSFSLPDNVDAECLYRLLDGFSDFPGKLNVSDNFALMNFIEIEAFTSGQYMGDFEYATYEFNQSTTGVSYSASMGMYCYVDRNVTVKGKGSETETYEGITTTMKLVMDVAFKKGWNIMYMTIAGKETKTSASGTITFTTKRPAGMKWYFEDDFGGGFFVAEVEQRSTQEEEAASKYFDEMQRLMMKHRPFKKSK